MRSKQYPKIASAWEDDPDCITIHMPGQDYRLSHDMVWEMIRQLTPLLPVEYRPGYLRLGALILSAFCVLCILALLIGSATAPSLFRFIAGWGFAGVLIQSILSIFLVWRPK